MASTIDLLKRVRTEHKVLSYSHDPKTPSYGLEAAGKLGLDSQRVSKTLLATTEKNELLVAVVPMIDSLDLKALAHATRVKKADIADPQATQRTAGYLMGGVNPLGQEKCLRTFINENTQQYPSIHVNAGRRGLEAELTTKVLAQLTQGPFAATGRE